VSAPPTPAGAAASGEALGEEALGREALVGEALVGEAPSTRSWPARIAQALVLAPIALYRRVISPAIPRRCKYEPTCSRYAVAAIREYGILRGLVLGCWRLLRCNPWSHGGYDPVEAQRVFAVDHAAHRRS
jgi:putative membrane protein insertion efficiency factor